MNKYIIGILTALVLILIALSRSNIYKNNVQLNKDDLSRIDTIEAKNYIDSLLNITNGASISVAVGFKDSIVFRYAAGLGNIETEQKVTINSLY